MLGRTECKRRVAGEITFRRVITKLSKGLVAVLEFVINKHEEIGPIQFGSLIGAAPHVKSFNTVTVLCDAGTVASIEDLTILA